MNLTKEEIRAAAEADLEVFIRLVAPHLVLGQCHIDLIKWWQSSVRKKNTLVLYPRAHLKSKLMAYKTAWEITKDPTDTVLYVSATSALAEKQLYLIKKILTSKTYMKYWPEMVHAEEAKRERWTAAEIAVDHPARAKEGVRDATVKAVGLTTNITGFHATKVKLDDVVVPGNAYTEDGRAKVANAISQIYSIMEPESGMDCVGTRYHGQDQYKIFLDQMVVTYDENDEVAGEEPLWDSIMRVVETDGEFLWPRVRRDDGKSFGFNLKVLATIRAGYTDKTQFYAQYYNNPNDPGEMVINRDKFQYYDRRFLTTINDRWHIDGKPLNVFAGLDFAYSLNKRSDWTALVVVGVNEDYQYFVLDIIRIKTKRIKDYFDAIVETHRKWGYKKIRCEVTAAQAVIVEDLKVNYIAMNNLNLIVDEHRPTRHMGSKEERISATLEPKYDNRQVWHYKGGLISDLEEELILQRPPHDDLKDGLTSAIDIAVAPAKRRSQQDMSRTGNVVYHSRFGGVSF